MGCFTVLKSKKKKSECPVHITRIKPQDCTSTVLPEPKIQVGTEGRTLQSAPSSFNTRTKPVQIATKPGGGRRRTISDPSTLVVPDHDVLSSIECDDHDDSKRRVGVSMELRTPSPSPSPQPLPLPSSQNFSVLKNTNSFKSGSLSPLYASGPLPLPPVAGLRNFSYEEIASACQQFSHDRFTSEGPSSSVIYKVSFGDDTSSSKKLEATVTRLPPSTQGFKEFVNEVNIIASLQHPHLCKLLGYHARDGSDHRMLVYERLAHGSLDFLLFGGSSGLPIDWGTRIKVALCAAQGLAFLHEEGPFQAMYNEISTANIQIDKDFSAKLSGYGCVNPNPEPETSNSSPAETVERGLITPKSNVWSFGIVILELLTGRKNLDARYPKEERNLAKWSKPYLADDFRLSLLIDPRLKGRYPTKAVRAVADIALKCLQNDPSERPTMRAIVESLKNAQEIKYSLRFPLQEPAAASKHMSRSPSLNGIYIPTPRFSFTHSSPLTMSPPLNCSSIENNLTQESRRSASSIITRRNGVEGF